MKILPKTEILAKNLNFGLQSKFWYKIEILVYNRNSGTKLKFWCKWKFWSKNEILAKNRNFGIKPKLWYKIEILVTNGVHRNYFFTFKIKIFRLKNIKRVQNRKFIKSEF